MNSGQGQGDHHGLISCQGQFVNSSYCWFKASQMCVSIIFIAVCIYELYKQFSIYGKKFQWRFFAIVFMMLSLMVNVMFCVWNYIYELYSFQTYFYNLYYLTIVGYVCRLYMRKNSWDQRPYYNYIFGVVIVVMGALYTATLIDSIVNQNRQTMVNSSCEQLWYLCVNVICLTTCLIALVILFINHREQAEKMMLMSYAQAQIRNPMWELWCWIGINTISQIINLVQTGLLSTTNKKTHCMIIRNSQLGNNILLFVFAVTSLTAGYAATLYYFAKIRGAVKHIQNINNLNLSQDLRGSFGVELVYSFLQGIQ